MRKHDNDVAVKHLQPIACMLFNSAYQEVISADEGGGTICVWKVSVAFFSSTLCPGVAAIKHGAAMGSCQRAAAKNWAGTAEVALLQPHASPHLCTPPYKRQPLSAGDDRCPAHALGGGPWQLPYDGHVL